MTPDSTFCNIRQPGPIAQESPTALRDAMHFDLMAKGYTLKGMWREYRNPSGVTVRVPMADPDAVRLRLLEPTDQLSLLWRQPGIGGESVGTGGISAGDQPNVCVSVPNESIGDATGMA